MWRKRVAVGWLHIFVLVWISGDGFYWFTRPVNSCYFRLDHKLWFIRGNTLGSVDLVFVGVNKIMFYIGFCG